MLFTVSEILKTLWTLDPGHPLYPLLPKELQELPHRHGKARAYMDSLEGDVRGCIDSGASIEGRIFFMGEGARIEPGAVIHRSCRLWLGEGATIRSGAVLRDEVFVGEHALIGAHCEVVRSGILPHGAVPHLNFLGDSIVGQGVNLAGGTIVANTTIKKHSVRIHASPGNRDRGLDMGCSRLGLLCGDGVSFGACCFVCPGTIVLPNLTLPPRATLRGVVDGEKRRRLWDRFFADCDD